MAEIGQDVPDGVSCFQIADGQEGCTTERYGATRIRINDTDRKIVATNCSFSYVGLII